MWLHTPKAAKSDGKRCETGARPLSHSHQVKQCPPPVVKLPNCEFTVIVLRYQVCEGRKGWELDVLRGTSHQHVNLSGLSPPLFGVHVVVGQCPFIQY